MTARCSAQDLIRKRHDSCKNSSDRQIADGAAMNLSKHPGYRRLLMRSSQSRDVRTSGGQQRGDFPHSFRANYGQLGTVASTSLSAAYPVHGPRNRARHTQRTGELNRPRDSQAAEKVLDSLAELKSFGDFVKDEGGPKTAAENLDNPENRTGSGAKDITGRLVEQKGFEPSRKPRKPK